MTRSIDIDQRSINRRSTVGRCARFPPVPRPFNCQAVAGSSLARVQPRPPPKEGLDMPTYSTYPLTKSFDVAVLHIHHAQSIWTTDSIDRPPTTAV
ncbi:hypothetical protein EVAR_92562_1 [Eumeta japonica]|uniref:Uncharacterized protein n=1 Tax=Eumeta variegata TaxID=151549 RepID=A0A4C1SX82_EUMVA|nr:hypothetical protein EVAR_92562_1 [Eumeta japonica]